MSSARLLHLIKRGRVHQQDKMTCAIGRVMQSAAAVLMAARLTLADAMRHTRKRRTRTEKKNTGQEPEQKRQNTGVRVLPVAQCAAADGRRATGDARWANTNDPPEGSWGVGQLDTSYRVYYHQSYTISTTEEARDQVTPFVSSIQCPIEGGEFEQKETILLPS